MVEHVADDGGCALVLSAVGGEALGAGVEGYSKGRVVGVETQDVFDRGVGEAEAGLGGEVPAQVVVGVNDAVGGGVGGAFVGVGAVEVRDVSEAGFLEKDGRVVGHDVAVDGGVEARSRDGGGVHEGVEVFVGDGAEAG